MRESELNEELPELEGGASSNVRFLIGAVVAVAILVTVAVTSFSSEVYFLTVSEAAAATHALENTEFRIKGHVVRDSYRLAEGTLDTHLFTLIEGGHEVDVLYRGALPDTFADDAEVVALGQLEGDGRFVAVEVVAKCPSRYEGGPPTGGALSSAAP